MWAFRNWGWNHRNLAHTQKRRTHLHIYILHFQDRSKSLFGRNGAYRETSLKLLFVCINGAISRFAWYILSSNIHIKWSMIQYANSFIMNNSEAFCGVLQHVCLTPWVPITARRLHSRFVGCWWFGWWLVLVIWSHAINSHVIWKWHCILSYHWKWNDTHNSI